MKTKKALAVAVVLGAPLCTAFTGVAVPKLFGMMMLLIAPFFGALPAVALIFVVVLIVALADAALAQHRYIIPF
ncbi:MAG: hypothetical protein HY650_04410 [Acidobacteria bacterium]|nr:hypothetical protein [Acidobacteriota bacterium]